MHRENTIRGLNFCASKAALAAGTTTTISTSNTVHYGISGKGYTKTAITNGATPTTDAVTGVAFVGVAANKGSVFVHCFDVSGNVKVAQGEVVDLDAGGNFTQAPEYPFIPDTLTPFGVLLIQAGASASTWTYGTSNQSGATGITYTRFDVLPALPSRPTIS